MNKILVVIATLALTVNVARADELDRAIDLLYKANDKVQTAIDKDICTYDASKPVPAIGAAYNLKHADVQTYNEIADALQRAYDSTDGTDSAEDAVADKFCVAVSER
jgi:hypothetical protein